MTALNFRLRPTMVFISMDTLASKPGGECLGFSSKVLPLPHLHGVVCGTGSLNLVLDWFTFIQTRVSASDMRDLDDVAPHHLPILAEKAECSNIESFHDLPLRTRPVSGKASGMGVPLNQVFPIGSAA